MDKWNLWPTTEAGKKKSKLLATYPKIVEICKFGPRVYVNFWLNDIEINHIFVFDFFFFSFNLPLA